MASRGEVFKINNIVEIIKKNSPISKVRLIMMSGLSISYFDKLKPFVEELHATNVRWDKDKKLWIYTESKDIESPLPNNLKETDNESQKS